MHYGFVFNTKEILSHPDPTVSSLAGQPVVIFPDTARQIDGKKYVDIMPCYVPGVKSISLRAGLLICNKPPGQMPPKEATVEAIYHGKGKVKFE